VLRLIPPPPHRGDDGVAAVLTVTVVGLVSLVLLSLVVDVGQMYEERRQLQNGADAAAVAVAADYLAARRQGQTYQNSTATSTAADLADRNARDGTASVSGVYGTPWGTTGPAQRNAYDPPAATYGKYVEVRTRTQAAGGGNLLPFSFSSGGATISAVGRASWGGLGSYASFPITMSICEWDAATSSGTRYAPAPPYPPNPASALEDTVELQSAAGTGCNRGPANQFAPGGFGWLDGGGDCEVASIANGWVQGSTGSSELNGCRDLLDQIITNRRTVFLPVFDQVTGTGSSARYHVVGYAAVVFTGYSLPGHDVDSWLTARGKKDCPTAGGSSGNGNGNGKGGGGSGGNQGNCLFALFTQALAPQDGQVGGSDFGVTTVRLVR
jgi:Flp pilus assembly protein TadG